MWLRYFLLRVATRTAAMLLIPLMWWYASKVLLLVMRANTALVAWGLSKAMVYAGEPWDHYALRFAQAKRWVDRGVTFALSGVSEEYRDRVEVFVRLFVLPDVGAWMMVGQLAGMFTLCFFLLRAHRNRRRSQVASIPEAPVKPAALPPRRLPPAPQIKMPHDPS